MDLELVKKLHDRHSFESPSFVFSEEVLMGNYEKFTELFPKALVRYAMKANFEPEILSVLARTDCGFEVASAYEYRLLKEHGVSPDRVVYGTAVKPHSHVKELFEDGVRLFAFDSSPEIEKIASQAPGSQVFVRLAVDDSGSVFKFSEKFGTSMSNIVPLLIKAQKRGLTPAGISFHVGSQANNPEAWSQAIESLIPIIGELTESGITLQFINIGGGFPNEYDGDMVAPDLSDIANFIYKAIAELPYEVEVMLEPGRAMVASAGITLGTVIARVEREAQTWLFLDIGVYNGLFETMSYQGSTRYKVSPIDNTYDAGTKLFALAGPTGDSPDVISREAQLPADIDVGDRVVFHDTGAYSLVACSPFNGFPKPSVYLV